MTPDLNPGWSFRTATRRGFFFRGLGIAVCNWRCLVWMWVINLVLAGLATVAFSAQAHTLLDHSLASQPVVHTLNLSYIAEFAAQSQKEMAIATPGALALDFMFFVIMFVAWPGVIAINLGDEIASFGNMVRTGLRFFWRFVRFGIVAALIAGAVMGLLHMLRVALLKPIDAAGATTFYLWFSGATLVLSYAVLAFFRVWFDLCEVIIVERGGYRLGRMEDRRVVRTLGTGWRLLFRGFWRVYLSFLLIGALGWAVLLFFIMLWHALPPFAPWRAFFLSEIGLFFLLGARFWQRGMEVAWFEKEGSMLTAEAVDLVGPPVFAVGPDVIGVPPQEPVSWPAPEPDPIPAPGTPEPQPPHAPPADVPPGTLPPEPDEPSPLPGGPEPLPA